MTLYDIKVILSPEKTVNEIVHTSKNEVVTRLRETQPERSRTHEDVESWSVHPSGALCVYYPKQALEDRLSSPMPGIIYAPGCWFAVVSVAYKPDA